MLNSAVRRGAGLESSLLPSRPLDSRLDFLRSAPLRSPPFLAAEAPAPAVVAFPPLRVAPLSGEIELPLSLPRRAPPPPELVPAASAASDEGDPFAVAFQRLDVSADF